MSWAKSYGIDYSEILVVANNERIAENEIREISDNEIEEVPAPAVQELCYFVHIYMSFELLP